MYFSYLKLKLKPFPTVGSSYCSKLEFIPYLRRYGEQGRCGVSSAKLCSIYYSWELFKHGTDLFLGLLYVNEST